MYVALSGHTILTCKINVGFIELKALLASIWMNPCDASSSKRSTTLCTATSKQVNCSPVVLIKTAKPSKNCHFWAQLAHQRVQYGLCPKQKNKFFAKITKADHRLSKTFYFIKISCVLAELWMFLYFLRSFLAKKGHFQP